MAQQANPFLCLCEESGLFNPARLSAAGQFFRHVLDLIQPPAFLRHFYHLATAENEAPPFPGNTQVGFASPGPLTARPPPVERFPCRQAALFPRSAAAGQSTAPAGGQEMMRGPKRRARSRQISWPHDSSIGSAVSDTRRVSARQSSAPIPPAEWMVPLKTVWLQ